MKQKKTQTNPRKVMQSQINELGNATGAVFNEINEMKQHLIGMEKLIMHFAEFLKKKDKFEKYLEAKIKEETTASYFEYGSVCNTIIIWLRNILWLYLSLSKI